MIKGQTNKGQRWGLAVKLHSLRSCSAGAVFRPLRGKTHLPSAFEASSCPCLPLPRRPSRWLSACVQLEGASTGSAGTPRLVQRSICWLGLCSLTSAWSRGSGVTSRTFSGNGRGQMFFQISLKSKYWLCCKMCECVLPGNSELPSSLQPSDQADSPLKWIVSLPAI